MGFHFKKIFTVNKSISDLNESTSKVRTSIKIGKKIDTLTNSGDLNQSKHGADSILGLLGGKGGKALKSTDNSDIL